jgi:hypothetical protein
MKVDVSAQVKHFPFATREVISSCAQTLSAATVFVMNPLDDGTYDVIVIDVVEGADDALVLELTVTSGAHRGEIVHVNARGLHRSWVDLLGTPATLNVTDGRPRVTLE